MTVLEPDSQVQPPVIRRSNLAKLLRPSQHSRTNSSSLDLLHKLLHRSSHFPDFKPNQSNAVIRFWRRTQPLGTHRSSTSLDQSFAVAIVVRNSSAPPDFVHSRIVVQRSIDQGHDHPTKAAHLDDLDDLDRPRLHYDSTTVISRPLHQVSSTLAPSSDVPSTRPQFNENCSSRRSSSSADAIFVHVSSNPRSLPPTLATFP